MPTNLNYEKQTKITNTKNISAIISAHFKRTFNAFREKNTSVRYYEHLHKL